MNIIKFRKKTAELTHHQNFLKMSLKPVHNFIFVILLTNKRHIGGGDNKIKSHIL